MKPMNSQSFDSDTRGQLILVGTVLIAAVLIILVLVLNGVLYTENIATREQPQSIDRSVDVTSVVEQTSEDLITFENNERYQEEGTAAEHLEEDIDSTSELLNERQFEAHGELTSIETQNLQNAWVVVQEDTSEFTSADQILGDQPDWEVATSDGIRGGVMTIDSAVTIDPDADEDDSPQRDEVFQLDVSGESGGAWSVWIFEHPTQDAIVVTDTLDGDGHPVIDSDVACISDEAPAEIDFTDMTVGEEQCDFEFAESVSDGPYELSFNQGDDIEGTYEFTLGKNPSDSDVELGNFVDAGTLFDYVLNTMDGDSPESGEPTAYDGVYSSTTQLVIDGEDVHLDTKVYAAPSQPDYTKSSEEQ